MGRLGVHAHMNNKWPAAGGRIRGHMEAGYLLMNAFGTCPHPSQPSGAST